MSSCLVIVDVQNGFISEYTRHIPKVITALMRAKEFNHVVASQFKNYKNSPYVKILNWSALQTADEQELCPSITKFAEQVFEKGTYTCFTDEFAKFCKSNNITTLYIAGIDTDCCVLTTAIDAFQKNIKPIVLAGCCASNGGAISHEAALKVLERAVGKTCINYDMPD